ncbi:hypothetical protein AZI87_16580 [Bdellovibrio bacteriovorus]|uniref:Uncharacterized protein n=1 Tax=Bdellovibrio bacteriovorus TaxID=959 RepID=A0A162FZQ0_BDEBC|nr:hypothetical protein [Bdellovibrio bacteriovorus]KYG62882.1 hypothetical protein AZI87_16580 [Bdellovibrio bacteriovorus]
MNSIAWTLIGGILAALQWPLDTFLSHNPRIRDILKVISFLIVVSTFTGAFFTYKESQESENRQKSDQIEILTLKNKSLELEKQLQTQENNNKLLSADLQSEKNKVKTISAKVEIVFQAPLNQPKPYAHNAINILVAHAQIPILELFLPDEPESVKFYHSTMWTYQEIGATTRFAASTYVKGDAPIMSSPKKKLLGSKVALARLPLMNLSMVQQPYFMPLKNMKITLQINDDLYVLEKPLTIERGTDVTQFPYNSILRFYLEIFETFSTSQIKKIKN